MELAKYTASSSYHGFNERLTDEAAHAEKPFLLFSPHRVEDVSKVKAEQKNGNDFFLHLQTNDNASPLVIRCENKFESYASGRLALEWVSVDRPQLKPGWMVTSKTAWLLSWFPTGDVIALPMDELRALVLSDPGRHQSTTALNRSYLSWSSLEDINYLVQNIPHARALDLRYELGESPAASSMLRGSSRQKRCTAEELTQLMRELPAQSTPLELSNEQLVEMMRHLAPVNRKKAEPQHRQRIQSLPWTLA